QSHRTCREAGPQGVERVSRDRHPPGFVNRVEWNRAEADHASIHGRLVVRRLTVRQNAERSASDDDRKDLGDRALDQDDLPGEIEERDVGVAGLEVYEVTNHTGI